MIESNKETLQELVCKAIELIENYLFEKHGMTVLVGIELEGWVPVDPASLTYDQDGDTVELIDTKKVTKQLLSVDEEDRRFNSFYRDGSFCNEADIYEITTFPLSPLASAEAVEGIKLLAPQASEQYPIESLNYTSFFTGSNRSILYCATHVNVSLWKDGDNLLADHQLSKNSNLAQHIIGAASCDIINDAVFAVANSQNDQDRLNARFDYKDKDLWKHSIRMKSHDREEGCYSADSTRAEYCVAGAGANAYMATLVALTHICNAVDESIFPPQNPPKLYIPRTLEESQAIFTSEGNKFAAFLNNLESGLGDNIVAATLEQSEAKETTWTEKSRKTREGWSLV